MDILTSLYPILKRCRTLYLDIPIPITLKFKFCQCFFVVNNNDIHLIFISELVVRVFGRSEGLRIESCYYTCPANESKYPMLELNHFFLILFPFTCYIQVILLHSLYQWKENYISF